MSETTKNISEFRKKYSRNDYPAYEFDQKVLMGTSLFPNSKIDVGLDAPHNVSDGVCFHLCRKWVIFRNYPILQTKEPKHEKYQPEIAYLIRTLSSTMISQALSDTNSKTTRIGEIFGLSNHDFRFTKSIGKSTVSLYFKQMTSGNNIFAIMHIGNSSGQHAIAFDMREGEFWMFDPNWGVFNFSKGSGEERENILRDWLKFIESKIRFATSFSRIM